MPSKVPAAGREFDYLVKSRVQVPEAELDEQERLCRQRRKRFKNPGESKVQRILVPHNIS
jgi:hypothetical protein